MKDVTAIPIVLTNTSVTGGSAGALQRSQWVKFYKVGLSESASGVGSTRNPRQKFWLEPFGRFTT